MARAGAANTEVHAERTVKPEREPSSQRYPQASSIITDVQSRAIDCREVATLAGKIVRPIRRVCRPPVGVNLAACVWSQRDQLQERGVREWRQVIFGHRLAGMDHPLRSTRGRPT